MTLNDYANARGKVVITFTSLKHRTGESIPAGHPDSATCLGVSTGMEIGAGTGSGLQRTNAETRSAL